MSSNNTFFIKSEKLDTVFAKVRLTSENQERHEMTGVILENNFPDQLTQLIYDFHQAIDEFAFAVVDIYEQEIQWYDLRLEPSGKRVFTMEFKGDEISFFTKFPTANGFLDEYPGGID